MSKLNLGRDLYLKGRIGWQGLSKDEYLENSDYKIINATALMDGYVDWENCGYITKERYEEAKEIMLQENDILISKDGTLGKIGYVKNLSIPCSVASGIFVLRNTKPNEVNFDYVYHILKSYIFKDFIRRNKAQGSTIPHLYQRDLENFEIDLPDYNLQTKIANILNSLDRKIMSNTNTISELEAMAKTLYDYWFLQFEFPNEEGKPYKSSGGKMVYNEELKREIPEGWVVKKLEKCIKHINTGLNPRDNFVLNTGNIKYITVKNLTTKGTLDFSGCDTIDFETKQLINKRSKVSKGDILFASIAPLGRCVIVSETPDNWEINESVFSIRPDYSTVSTEYLYMFFMSDYFIKTAEHSSTGSIFSGIRVAVLNDMNTLVPTKKIMDKFTEYVKPLFNKKYFAEIENQELSSLRDFLLPMLMNGQVTFK